MAKSPTITAGAPPLSDLLFSPRAAFIWSHTRKSVAWMNPAARAAFALRLEDFSASIPASLVRQFAKVTARRESGFVKVKIAGAPPLACSVEILNLADGQDGVIVAELAEGEQAPPALPISGKPARRPAKTARKMPAGAKRRTASKTPPALTAEEMRAFKAVGRKVLRLCEDKKEAAPAASPPVPSNGAVSKDQPAQALMDVLAAFDLVLFLSERLDIVDMKGRPARLGWRKGSLTGKSVADVVLPYDRAILRRMLKKLHGQTACNARGTLVVGGENGTAMPCRAILGRWKEGNAAFFLAFISLELPARLKRPQLVNAVARLAA